MGDLGEIAQIKCYGIVGLHRETYDTGISPQIKRWNSSYETMTVQWYVERRKAGQDMLGKADGLGVLAAANTATSGLGSSLVWHTVAANRGWPRPSR